MVYYDRDAHGKPLWINARRLFDALEALESGQLEAKKRARLD
jgi:hypothetical protein